MTTGGSPNLVPVVGPDGLARDAPVISYTEKKIEEEQQQLKRYINENYSKIREVERELENLTLEMKLTAGPKKAALEHLRKMIELSTERIRGAKLKEDQARKAWEAAAKIVKDEEAMKQKLCDDLNSLVQESAASQFLRLEELKKRLEALNPTHVSSVQQTVQINPSPSSPTMANVKETQSSMKADEEVSSKSIAQNPSANAEVGGRKKVLVTGRGKGNSMVFPKNKNPGWTGAGFDVDGRV
ncbi:junctophilin-like protein [Wolffia australiana]